MNTKKELKTPQIRSKVKRTADKKQEKIARTAQAKKRVRDWAEAQIMQQQPVVIATQITTEGKPGTSTIAQYRDHTTVLERLEVRKTVLIQELAKIEIAIRVIRRSC